MNKLAAYAQNFKEKPVVVFGLARSGLSTIKALKAAGVSVIAWDDNEKSRSEAKNLGADLKELNETTLKNCALLVLAPGVPLYFPKPHPVVTAAKKAGIEIICDLELFHRLNHGRKTIGITGTNGKSTTTALIHHILKSAGIDSIMGGNIGLPVFDLKIPDESGVFVFELSSYQLDLCPGFHPGIAVLLNITPDHIDRHGTMENYVASKEKIFEGQGAAIISMDDHFCREIQTRVRAKNTRKITPLFTKDDFLKEAMTKASLKGEHNYQNALAAYAVCKEIGIAHDKIIEGIQSFPGLPHRQFPVRTIRGVTYINDSKATNAEATSKALACYENIYWIVGGRAKEGGLTGLEPLMPRVQKAYLIGEAMNEFSGWAKQNKVPCALSGILQNAVLEAHKDAQQKNNGVVLLSPACASFDQFSSYEERGDIFTQLVSDLKESAAA